MGKALLIVESPTKAKTISQYLPDTFTVKSSMGHIRDLPKSKISVDIQKNFEPVYEVPQPKKKTVAELKAAIKSASDVWLGTDEDREGEAIAWHLAEVLKIPPGKAKRIVFHEITKNAISASIQNPRPIDKNLVDAQQARRILDRLVGYELSPVLWKKVRPGLSAGRVQSVAVRLVVEREREIENYKTSSKFKLTGRFVGTAGEEFSAEGEQTFNNESEALAFLTAAQAREFSVDNIQTSPALKRPPPPFTTSTLQQTSANALGFSVKQTMMLAQSLYEAGHISYMRTDSVNLGTSALEQAQRVITGQFGKDYYIKRQFKSKGKGAQEAHEAIRPTDFSKSEVSADARAQKLYKLIWSRAIASQMADAQLERTILTIGLSDREEKLRAGGEVIKFDGWLKVTAAKASNVSELPKLAVGDKLKLVELLATETYSRPKSRYSEASLVKKLEALGIGRPSTYAPIISTIQDRGYVEKIDHEGAVKPTKIIRLKDGSIAQESATQAIASDQRRLSPTQTGIIVTDFLLKHFPKIVDYDFTADIENRFDTVAAGNQDWRQLLAEFYTPFHATVESSDKVSRMEATQGRLLGKHPTTGKPIYVRLGRFGPMVQMGQAEDDEKPAFAPLPKGADMQKVTLADVLKLFEFPKVLGKHTNGEEISVNLGPYGPYVKNAEISASLKDIDPANVDLDTAKKILAEKAQANKERVINEFKGSPLKILKGPYGPYVTDGKKNARIPKDQDPAQLDLAAAELLLSNKISGRRIKRQSK